MKHLFLTLAFFASTLGFAEIPFTIEEEARFSNIENMTGAVTFSRSAGTSSLVDYSTSGDGSFPILVAIVNANYSQMAAASNVVFAWSVPANALIANCHYEVNTTFQSSGDNATIGFQVEVADDIVAAAAISSGTTWDATGAAVLGVPDFATVGDWVKMGASAKDLVAARGVEALTAGDLILYCMYFQGE